MVLARSVLSMVQQALCLLLTVQIGLVTMILKSIHSTVGLSYTTLQISFAFDLTR
jgi:hypothetical protein